MNKFKLFIYFDYDQLMIALFENDKKLGAKHVYLNKDFIEQFFVQLRSLLTTNKIKTRSLTHLYVASGPGSFISNRILAVFLKSTNVLVSTAQLFTLNKFFLLAGFKNKKMVLLQINRRSFHYQAFDSGSPAASDLVTEEQIPALKEQFADYQLITNPSSSLILRQFSSLEEQFIPVSWTNLKIASLNYLPPKPIN